MSEAAGQGAPPSTGQRRLFVLLPLAGFLALAVLFYFRLGAGDPSRIPSALINKPTPEFSLPPIVEGEGGGLASKDLASGVHIVNVFASWCAPCRLEHPILMQLAEDKRFSLVGIDYKDVSENAARFLGALGSPYAQVGADRDGRTAIDWGVYGVPESFIVRNGTILYKFVGPLSEEGLAKDFMPALEKALAGQ